MTPERWKQIEAVFERALEVPPTERAEFLQAIEDNELRGEVESLLEAHREAGAFIDEPDRFFSSESFETEAFSPGQLIDRYRIIREIGRGGMGAVFLAERADDEYRKQVAIKVIKRGTDTDSVLRHFRNERQILASLEHPNIARLLDGGTTSDGLPYFVMEYIVGQRIDQYAEQKGLSITARLEMFRQVCGAVSYAHQNLVVHRDLKPSNILVTPEGVPKLLDFGIAKIIQPHADPAALATVTIMPAMTPGYASPEQIEGAPATTLSDVYSLGAILYELLAGQKPLESKGRTSNDISPAIIHHEPRRPSTVVSVDRKPKVENRKSLEGDLDNIVLMAMHGDTARRYGSVEQFSEDIRRYLAGRPVLAQRDTLSYRATKFLQRNRLAISAAAVIFLTLIGGIVATAWQAHKARLHEQRARAEQARAERRFSQVRKLANSVLFDYHDAIKALPGATKVRERLLKDGVNYLDSLAGEAHGDPDLQRELAAAYERVGDVRGGEAGGGSLGDVAGARESYAKALTILETLVAANPSDAQARRDLASSQEKIGYLLLGTAEASIGVDHLRKALSLYLDLTRDQPGNDDLQLELVDTYNKLGQALKESGDLIGALEQHRAASAICEGPAARPPQDQKYRRALWTTYERTADVLYLHNDVAGAIEANSKALALGEALVADDPINADYRRGLVLNYQSGGNYRRMIDPHGALEYFRRAVALDEELLAADPANALTRKDLAYQHKRMADFLGNLHDDPQSLLHYRKALDTYQQVIKDSPTDLISQFLVATCRAGAAQGEARLGEMDRALEECRKAIALLGEITEDATNARQRYNRAQGYESLGFAYLALAASPKASASERRHYMSSARDMYQQSLNVLDDLRSRGIWDAATEDWAKNIAGQIAECDTALGK